MNINFIFKLKNALMTLVFLIAISSNCFAGGDDVVSHQKNKVLELEIKSGQKVIELKQDTIISEIRKNKYKYRYLYKYFTINKEEAGLCELLSDYVAYRRLLNEESADQVSNIEIVLNDLETILKIVEKNKKEFQYSELPVQERDKMIEKLVVYINKGGNELINKEYQLAGKSLEKAQKVLEDWWEEMDTKNQVPTGATFLNQVVISYYNVFTLQDIVSNVIDKDSSGSLTIDKEIFMDRMREVEVKAYIKFGTLDCNGSGHMMLIAKNGDDNFAFFDPNMGIMLNLTLEDLFKVTNDIFRLINNAKGCDQAIMLFNSLKAVERAKNRFGDSIVSYFLPSNFYFY